ncbi:MAG: ComEA family DNA-binding protein [Dehalococcoidales bacterium]
MKSVGLFNGWAVAALLLVIVIIAGGAVIWSQTHDSRGVALTLAPAPATVGNIYVGGEVNNPGWYPLFSGDGINGVIQAAGGVKEGADISRVELTVGGAAAENTPQKIDINRAEAWLLQALPGVGEVKAQAIVAYREQNGLFHDIAELKRVPGFGEGIFNDIKDLITVN